MLLSDQRMPESVIEAPAGNSDASSGDIYGTGLEVQLSSSPEKNITVLSVQRIKSLFEGAFDAQFTILDGASGEVLVASPAQPKRDWGLHGQLCREVSRRGRPEFIDEEDPFLTLALPMKEADGTETVAVATFLTRRVAEEEDISRSAELLGMRPDEASAWARTQMPWTPEALKTISDLVLDGVWAKHRIEELQKEANSLSVNLASTYEEISLLYRLTQNLKLSESEDDLGRVALEWMQEVLPAAGLAIQFLQAASADDLTIPDTGRREMLLTRGDCPLNEAEFSELIALLAPQVPYQPIVVNRSTTEHPDWPFPQIRQVIAVALAEGENLFGWLVALNHVEDAEFGTVEASLLSSVAAILGIHGGNIDLYRQQSELLAGMVRALTSAVEAKDPYTCGHSDRVARVAVHLAEELGCDAKMIKTLYLAGLLHDIGKIGIDDNVLRKAGSLSHAEYEHIKQHVDIGHRILHDLAKLEEVLPVVLHHHESWDGGGYPNRLNSERIPLAARIVAVADAFDAMSSDRPYRKRMPDEEVDRILRAGAGQQWDPKVIDAFFRVSEDIRKIGLEEK
jgi:putative nucleotidyltransferase with HDIG domain